MDTTVGFSVKESIVGWKAPLDDDKGMEDTLEIHRKKIVFKIGFILSCLVITFFVMALAITYGAADISIFETYGIIWDHITGNIQDVLKDRIVCEIRLPRILTGALVGAALAVGGVVLQSVLRNPLADPYTTGVSSGASLGAVIAMTAGVTIISADMDLIFLAFLFSLLPLTFMIVISKFKNSSPTTMIMAGIGIMYIFNAITTFLMLLTDPNNLARVYRWQVGTLDLVTPDDVLPIALVTLAGIIAIQLLSKRLNILSTGDDNAKGLGLNVDNTRILFLGLVGLITATVVSFTGLIGFVGLVVPHIARLFIGSDNKFLVLSSATLGSAILVIADLIGRWILSPAILQVGVIMAFFGGPLFLWLLIRKNNALWK